MSSSMSKSITVRPETLRTQSGTIAENNGVYKGLYQKLVTEVDELKSQWKGNGNDTFVQQIHNFEPQFEKLFNVLNSYCEFLNDAARIYDETESNVTSNANRLRI